MSRALLVTGGAGFIGSNFVHYWLGQYPLDRVVVLDALTYAGNRANLAAVESHPGFSFVHGDICDQALVESLLRERQLDTIVHFAAESHVDRSITGPGAFIQTNVVGTYSLLEAARAVWLAQDIEHRFHHVSTDEVYGSLTPDAPGFHEEQKYEPNSPYSASKAASDHLVRSYLHTFGLQVTTSNCSNNYGPWHFPEKLIPLCLTNILRGLPLPVYGDGKNIRDWLHVEDHCRGIELVLNGGRIGETYNIGGNNEWTNIDILHLLCERMDALLAQRSDTQSRFPAAPAAHGGKSSDLIEYVTDRAGHDRRYAIDASRIMNELGYKPRHSFESGLEATLHWYLDNEDWWRPLLVQ